jgi:hypothetical protein
VPVDISAEFLAASAQALAAAHPGLDVLPVAADFTQPLELPISLVGKPMLGFFPAPRSATWITWAPWTCCGRSAKRSRPARGW